MISQIVLKRIMLKLLWPLGLVLALGVPAVLAKDNGQFKDVSPQTREWVRGLKDKNNIPCCDTADGWPVNGVDIEWDAAGGKYMVRIEGQWIEVPDSALLDEPNRLGHPVAWYIHENGKPVVRCFLPGAGG